MSVGVLRGVSVVQLPQAFVVVCSQHCAELSYSFLFIQVTLFLGGITQNRACSHVTCHVAG